MKKTKKSEIDKIEHALYLAHRSQPQTELAEEWPQSVMRQIRRIAPAREVQNTGLTPAYLLSKIVPPFASAAGFAAIALVVYAIVAFQGIEQQLFTIAAGDPVSACFMNLMGL